MRRAVLTLTVALALLGGAAGCGDDDGDEETDASTTSSTEAPADPGSTSTEATTTSEAGTTSTVSPSELPGEPIDIFPYADAALDVVGVGADDTLNVRSGPGTDFEVVIELDPLSSGEAVATGNNRTVGDAIWVEIDVDATVGWANGTFLAQAGVATDITADVADTSADTVAALAEAVAATRVSEGEGPTPTVTIVDGPTDTEVTIDVIGLADDAQKGERLRITAAPGGAGVTATAVEAIALCARGVTADGLCV